MPTIYVIDLPEFRPIVDAARQCEYSVSGPEAGYWTIYDTHEIRFERKKLNFGPALWNTALAGGIRGTLVAFDSNALVLKGDK